MSDNLPARATNRDLETLPFDQALDAYSPNLAEALPDHIPLQRFKRVVITAVNQNPELARADRRSLFNACVTCALDGLYPDGREAVLLTFRTRQKDGSHKVAVSYIPMIAGVRKRMRNSGEVLSATSELVHKNDHFRYAHGDHPILEHEPPALDVDRGPVIGAYAIIRLRNGETIREVMSLREIERIRGFSRSANSTDSPWVKHPGQMARKTVLKRAANSAPISAEMEQLFRRDEEAERLLPPPPPPPTREQFMRVASQETQDTGSFDEGSGYTFDVVRDDGVIVRYDDPEDAAIVIANALRDARGNAKAVAAILEDNADALASIEGVRPDLIDDLGLTDAIDEFPPIPERAAVVEPESKPPEALLESAVDGAGSSSETKARQSGDEIPANWATAARITDSAAVAGGAPREAPPIQMPPAFNRHADLLANREALTPVKIGDPPIRNGKPDYRTWRIVLFDAAARKCKTVEEFATLIGDCHETIEAHDRALPDQAGAFRAAREARMSQLDSVGNDQ